MIEPGGNEIAQITHTDLNEVESIVSELNTPENQSPLLPTPDPDAIVLPDSSLQMQIGREQVDLSESLKHSPEQYQREAYLRAEGKVSEIESYVRRKILTPQQGRDRIVAEIALGEINGLKDPLTQLLNKTGFNERLARQISRVRRTREDLSVLFVDLVGFKAVNDTLGHDIGDLIIRWTAEFIKEVTRDEDEVARLQGDEFTISGVQSRVTSSTQEVSFVDRMLEEFEGKYSEFIQAKLGAMGLSAPVGARIGVANYAKGDSVDTLIKRSDTDMNSKRDPNKPSR